MYPQPPCRGKLPLTLLADVVARLRMHCLSGGWYSGTPNIDGRPRPKVEPGLGNFFSSCASREGSPSSMPCSSPAASWSLTGSEAGPLVLVDSSFGLTAAPFGLLGAEPGAWVGGELVRLASTSSHSMAVHTTVSRGRVWPVLLSPKFGSCLYGALWKTGSRGESQRLTDPTSSSNKKSWRGPSPRSKSSSGSNRADSKESNIDQLTVLTLTKYLTEY